MQGLSRSALGSIPVEGQGQDWAEGEAELWWSISDPQDGASQVALKLIALRVVPRSDEKVQKDRPVGVSCWSIRDRGEHVAGAWLWAWPAGSSPPRSWGMHTLVTWETVCSKGSLQRSTDLGALLGPWGIFLQAYFTCICECFPSIGTCRHRHLQFRKSASCLAFWFYN